MQFEYNCNIQSVAKTLSDREIFTQHRNVYCVVEQQQKKLEEIKLKTMNLRVQS